MKQDKIKKIMELEQKLSDCQLKYGEHLSEELLEIRSFWSEEVIKYALLTNKRAISDRNAQRGKRLIAQPILIGGCPRSGTTLLSNLIDGHPEICCLPSESLLFEVFHRRISNQPNKKQFEIIANDWLQRLASPTNWGSYFFLGRTTSDSSPYVEFVKHLEAWWDWCEGHLMLFHTKPLVAVTLAYASLLGKGDIPERFKYWLEKSPGNECFYDLFKKDFPESRFVFLLRNPMDVMRSHLFVFKKLEMTIYKDWVFKNRRRYLSLAKLIGNEDVYLIKYEDLIAHQAMEMNRLLRFIGVEYDENNSLQTINGLETKRNSSFSPEKKELLTITEEEKMQAYYMGKPVWQFYPEVALMPEWNFTYYKSIFKLFVSLFSRSLARRSAKLKKIIS